MSLEKTKRQLLVENKRLRKELEELRQLVGIDPLTKAFNRYQIKKEVARAERDGTSLGLLIVDINHFKQINDLFGHQAGDKVLIALAEILRRSVRKMDSVIRYGGDEFLILLPDIKGGLEQAIKRIFSNLKKEETKNPILGKDHLVTIAIGGAVWHPLSKKTWKDSLNEADKAMYYNKESFRKEGAK